MDTASRCSWTGFAACRLDYISIAFAAIRALYSSCKLRYELGVARRIEDRYVENSVSLRNHLARVAARMFLYVFRRVLCSHESRDAT